MKSLRTRRLVGVGAALAVLALPLTACSSDSGSDTGSTAADANDIAPTPRDEVADGGTLRWPLEQTIQQFNYNQLDGPTQYTFDIISGMLPSPFNFDAAAVPSVNTDYFTSIESTTDDPQVITYTVNPDAKWNDGKAIGLADFQAQWKALNGSNEDFIVASTTGYEDIKSVEAGDADGTIVVTMKSQYADWRGLFSPLYPASVNATPEAFNKSLTKGNLPVSAGPFKLDNFNATQETYTAVPDPNWWGDKAKLDKIVYRNIDPNAAVEALANNELDFVDIGADAAKFATASSTAGIDIRRAGGPLFRHITFNGQSPLLKDVKVRQAIAKGINRQQIADALLGPLGGTPTPLGNHIFMSNQAGYVDNSGVVGFDVAAANSELDALGWTKDGDFRKKDGKELRLNILIPADFQVATDESTLITQQLKAIGVNTKITSLGDDFFDAGVAPGKFDLTIFTWVGNQFPISASKSIYSPVVDGDVQQNFGQVNIPEVTPLYEAAVKELDPAKAQEIGNQIDKLVWENVHSLATYQRPDLKGVRDTVVNYGALGFATIRYQDIGFKKGSETP